MESRSGKTDEGINCEGGTGRIRDVEKRVVPGSEWRLAKGEGRCDMIRGGGGFATRTNRKRYPGCPGYHASYSNGYQKGRSVGESKFRWRPMGYSTFVGAYR